MKNTVILYIIIFYFVSCNRGNEIILEKNTAVMNYPEEFKEKDEENFEYKSGDTVIKVTSYKDSYIETKNLVGKNFEWSAAYNKRTLKIASKHQQFLNLSFGLSLKFDSKGNVCTYKNFDKGFNISITDLIRKLKTERNINLNDSSTFLIQRIDQNSLFLKPKYQVCYISSSGERYILVDGNTGEILKEERLLEYCPN